MAKTLEFIVSGAKPLRHGTDYVWSLILELTRDGDTFLYRDLAGMCDQKRLSRVRVDLRNLVAAGYLARLPEERPKGTRPYRLLKRQAETPNLRVDGGGESTFGRGIEHMWNAMRRAHNGFTTADLAIDASTDEVSVSHQHAKAYCLLLERAGLLKRLSSSRGGVGRTVYVLLGSANTGPKPPRRYKSTFVYDENKGRVIGAPTAEEIAP
ncbi:hypothetical protein [Shinella zoogloeoides]|uniref:Uncharacterized protein n=1 Tax=Shinella zoogloeoides TaxID=352475 RepID=A0A6N8TA08_SHIZO|nr:hypothetical protein [Shinella zoogloeoides]MXN99410.1 hypothetical protein [Shinella zoogloeoides]UEX82811.1 hypothetical protein K8M09_05895 [Shinella zoogloeoides]